MATSVLRSKHSPAFKFGVGVFLVLFAGAIFFDPVRDAIRQTEANAELQNLRAVNTLLYQYAVDHDDTYPEGNSSTEVFQKLIDGKYCDDPAIFYVHLPGKTPAESGQKLKAENVAFDVTSGATLADSPYLPMVFRTGLKVHYVPNGSAMLTGAVYEGSLQPIAFLGNNVVLTKAEKKSISDGSISGFVPPEFDPKGKTYRQLTPDGVLEP